MLSIVSFVATRILGQNEICKASSKQCIMNSQLSECPRNILRPNLMQLLFKVWRNAMFPCDVFMEFFSMSNPGIPFLWS